MVNRTGCRTLFLILLVLDVAAFVTAQGPPPGARAAASRVPEEFGTQDYVVSLIPAASFTADTTASYFTDPTSLFRTFTSDDSHFYAGVTNLPSGAVLDYIGLESWSKVAGSLVATLYVGQDVGAGNAGAGEVMAVLSGVHAAAGYGIDYNPTPQGWTVSQNVNRAYTIDVHQIQGQAGPTGVFGWVELWWKRSVSPAPATASFNDVPVTHPLFQYVEALKTSGITGGCSASPPLFCPSSPVTRGQMAVFLSKALGLHWPN